MLAWKRAAKAHRRVQAALQVRNARLRELLDSARAVADRRAMELDALRGPVTMANYGNVCHHMVASNSAWRCALCFDAELESLRARAK